MQADYPVKTICAVLDLPRSSFYHRTCEAEDADLRSGWTVNPRRIQRLMREMGLLQCPVKRRQKRTTDSQHDFPCYPNRVADLEPSRPDEVWVADITDVCLAHHFVYLAVIMDVFTRCVRAWHLSRSLDRDLTLTALKRALVDHVPDIHHSDQGWQYACGDYTDLLTEYPVQISMAALGKPEENGYAERLMRTIQEEEVDLPEYADFYAAYQSIGRFLDEVYTRKRIHPALGYLTPAEFEENWLTQQPEPVLK
jgi:transposase InsO family protein